MGPRSRSDASQSPKESSAQAGLLLRRLEWRIRRSSGWIVSGQYRSALRGKGREFDSVVKYEFGDDVRDIDWNVSARMGELYRKKFVEERELSLVLVFEDSPSLSFTLGGPTKREFLLECAVLVGILARMNRDRLGLWYTNGKESRFYPPARSWGIKAGCLTYLLRASAPPIWEKTPIEIPWDFLLRALPRHSILFWLGDFPPRSKPRYWEEIRRRFQPIGFRALDPREEDLPLLAPAEIFDPVTGQLLERAPGSFREDWHGFQQWWEKREEAWESFFPHPANRWTARTSDSPLRALVAFFRHRMRLLRRG
ncbi:DUF58 domain-containing protein [Candidatus Methylacidithermus pantelleriae]|uniref:DUF58 domain-containing protein n=1 Tax=Candidatus Methylacidithermus pantelleriae TaxID=2744239 RepID=A0A8J2BFI7_9BACT|nr:DUF58 domain-containing protein [Candidatus Methylacidithermus pantelleriae]CAF0689021.1 DUF58 domain-containing protein [Candidatus Methylacidithermus pantelleriae]